MTKLHSTIKAAQSKTFKVLALTAGLLAGTFSMALQTADVAMATGSSPAPIDVSDAMRYDVSGPIGTKLMALEFDDVTTVVESPFAFSFFGTTYNYLCITSNGGIYPVASASSSCSNRYDQSVEQFALSSQAPMIAALGADQHPGRLVSAVAADTAFSGKPTGEAFAPNESDGFGIPGSIYFGTTTVNGNTAAVVTWYRTVMYEDASGGTQTQTFQIVLIDGEANNYSTDWDMTIEYNYGQLNADYDGYNVNGSRRWAVGWSDYDSTTNTALAFEFYADLPTSNLIDSGSYALVDHSLNSDVPGRYIMGMQGGETVGFQPVTPNPPTTFQTTELGNNGGNLTVGQPVSEYLDPDVSSVCEVTSGSVPAGITFYPGTCQIAGTPTEIGSYEFEVTASNTAGSVSTTFSGDVAGPPADPATDVMASVDGMDVTVSWVNPTNDGGSAIIGAQVVYTPQGCSPSVNPVSVNATQNPFTYSNLEAGCTYSVTVTPYNGIGPSTAGPAAANTTVLPMTAPVWMDTTVATPVQGAPFSDGVLANLAATYEITAGELPAGLTLDSATGAITGTPVGSGAYNFTVTSSNSEGTNSVVVSGNIANRHVTLTDDTLATPQHSATLEYSDFFAGVTESNEVVTYALEGDLPAGMTLDTNTGEISGIATEAGTFQFAVVANGPLQSTSKIFVWEIEDRTSVAIDTDIVEIGTGIAVNESIEVSYATGYAVTAGELPEGLTLNTETGEITGTPLGSGSYEVTITAYGEVSNVEVTLSGTVHTPVAAPAPEEIVAPTLVHGSEGANDLSVEGATGYEVTAGELPEGLTLNAETGEITGTPTVPGDYNFTVTATGPVNSVDVVFEGNIADRTPVAPAVTDVTAPQFSALEMDASFEYATEYSLAPLSGDLPAGLTLNAETGLISGTPEVAGTYTFVVLASGPAGSSMVTLTVVVPAAPNVDVDDVKETVEVSEEQTAVISDGQVEFSVAANDVNGNSIAADLIEGAAGRLVVTLEGTVQVSGSGFAPGSSVDVWVFSTPTFVGSVLVGADGSFSAEMNLPEALLMGEHTLQANGATVEGAKSLELPLLVLSDADLPKTGTSSGGAPAWAFCLLVAGVVLVLSSRRRHAS